MTTKLVSDDTRGRIKGGECWSDDGVRLLACIENGERIIVELEVERDRLQRACDEGLPREYIECPACAKPHVEGPRHDNPALDGRTRPHHTHRCYHCGHIWDTGRWSFGVDVPKPASDTRDARIATLEQERDELRAIVEGRKVAPTLAEIAKHSGEWLCDGEAVSLYFSDDHDTKLRVRAASMTASIGDTAARVWLLMKNAEGARWIALDDGRPCAWPKVTP